MGPPPNQGVGEPASCAADPGGNSTARFGGPRPQETARSAPRCARLIAPVRAWPACVCSCLATDSTGGAD
eukprot:7499016-Alexandrium_andersonii.AAC.1